MSDDDCDDDLDDHMFLCNAKARIIIIIITFNEGGFRTDIDALLNLI